jgi:hypothetical protein
MSSVVDGRGKLSGFVFPGCVARSHLSHGQIRRVIKQVLERVGVSADQFSSHSLRCGEAQLLDLQQASMQELQSLGSWWSESALYKYLSTHLEVKFMAASWLVKRSVFIFVLYVCGWAFVEFSGIWASPKGML